MNKPTNIPHAETATSVLLKAAPQMPALILSDDGALRVRPGTVFNGVELPPGVHLLAGKLEAGCDYVVTVEDGVACASKLTGVPDGVAVLGGFHYAPGGNAVGRSGGNDAPAINPFSLWDINFRPACPDPRGMVLVHCPDLAPFWCDIYLTATDHLANGTSRFGATIADGDDPPQKPDGGRFDDLNYETALAVMRHHGKGLLSVAEFFAAAFGVTERSSADIDPNSTKLDAPRTSGFGLMQATGNIWVWGHDGDPDQPRASIFGGSWLRGSYAGSRFAHLGYWPAYSYDYLGARGRCDHLQRD
jgi:hypothetical protein